MQKKLLGVAVAAALVAPGLALAQSSVQIYGTINMSLNQTRFSGDSLGNPSVSKWGVDQTASNWGLRSTETLGGGMSSWFQAEFNTLMQRSPGVVNAQGTARNSGVGLRGGFGNIYLGQWETPWAQTFRFWDVGTIGGWGPTTSIIGRRETSTNGRAWNCGNGLNSAGNLASTTGSTTPAAQNNPAGTNVAGTAATIVGNTCAYSSDGAPNFSQGNVTAATVTTSGTIGNLGYPLWRRSTGIFYESPEWSGLQVKLHIHPNLFKSQYANPTNN